MNNELPPELTLIEDVMTLWQPYADKYETFKAFWNSPEALELRQRYENVELERMIWPWGASRAEYIQITSIARIEMRYEAGIATAEEQKVAEALNKEQQRAERRHMRKQERFFRWLIQHFPQPPGTHLVEVTLVINEILGVFECTIADEYEECLWQLAWELVMHDTKDKWNILIRPATARKEKEMWLRIKEGDDQP